MAPKLHKRTVETAEILIEPTREDLERCVRKACDPRSCQYNLAFARALHDQLGGEITRVWVDGGHHRFSWRAPNNRDRYRWSGDTPVRIKNALIALDQWDKRGRKKGLACPINARDLMPYRIVVSRKHKIFAQTEKQKDAAYKRVQKQRAEGKVFARRRSLHDRVVGFA